MNNIDLRSVFEKSNKLRKKNLENGKKTSYF